jgi:DNA invertase Pin-like site-specific DNA recombinase
LKVGGYVRVSTDGQVEGYGLDAQTEALRTWCALHGHRLVHVYSDEGVSGTLEFSERPGLSAALDALRPPPEATGLLVPRLDRLARALHVQEAALQVAWLVGASVCSVDGGEVLRDDPDDPRRTFVRQAIGCVSQLGTRHDVQADAGWSQSESCSWS